ncbi:hypothetical protein C8R45DRAFT_1221320 [Mycena sanguinolenta]|nr:hypothetical protein C8R45DRAFT_1221320 [Mycena sanguinolenta]
MAITVLRGTKESYIGALLENILYGLYLSVFLEFCMLFYKSKIRSGVHTYLLITSGLMFILITMRCIIDTYRCIAAFDNALNFGPPNSPLGILTNSCWLMVFSIADVFIVFRTFVVWDRRWLMITLPAMLCLGNFIISVLSIVSYGELDRSNPSIWATNDWLTIIISLTLSTNVVCTGLISFRIIQIHRRVVSIVAHTRRSLSMKFLSVIVESGLFFDFNSIRAFTFTSLKAAIYTAVLVATMIIIRTESFVFFVFIDCVSKICPDLPMLLYANVSVQLSPLIGLVFLYIIIRVSRGTSYGERTMGTTSISQGHYRANNRDFQAGPTIGAPSRSGGGTEVQIRLEQTTYESAQVDPFKPEGSPLDSNDLVFCSHLAPIILTRGGNMRTGLRNSAISKVATHYELNKPGTTPSQVRSIVKQLLDQQRYILPYAPTPAPRAGTSTEAIIDIDVTPADVDATATGSAKATSKGIKNFLTDSPFHAPAIVDVIHDTWWNTRKALGFKHAEKLRSNRADRPQEIVLPDAMICLAAANVWAALQAWETGRHVPARDFTQERLENTYTSLCEVLEKQRNGSSAKNFNKTMHDLYNKVSNSNSTEAASGSANSVIALAIDSD